MGFHAIFARCFGQAARRPRRQLYAQLTAFATGRDTARGMRLQPGRLHGACRRHMPLLPDLPGFRGDRFEAARRWRYVTPMTLFA